MNFTKEELYWIEREADLQSTMMLSKFFQLVQIDIKDKNEDEKKMLKLHGTELINGYLLLKELRRKLEHEREEKKD